MKRKHMRFAAALLCALLLCALLPLGTLAQITTERDFWINGETTGTDSITVSASSTNFAADTVKGLKYKAYDGADTQPATMTGWITAALNNDLAGWADASSLSWRQTSGNQCSAKLDGLAPGTLYMFCAYYGNSPKYSPIGRAYTRAEATENSTTLSHSATDSSVLVTLRNSNTTNLMNTALYFTRLSAPVTGWSGKSDAEKLAWRKAQNWERAANMNSSATSRQDLLYPLDPGEYVAYYSSFIDYTSSPSQTEYVSAVNFAQATAGTRNRSTDVWSVKFAVVPDSHVFGMATNPTADQLTVSYTPTFEPIIAKLQVCADPTFASGPVHTAVTLPSTSAQHSLGLLYPMTGWLVDENLQPLSLSGVYYYRIMVLDTNYRVWYSNVRFFEVSGGHIQAANASIWSDGATSVGVTNGLMSGNVRSAVAFGVADASGSAVSPAAGTTVDVATLYRLGFTASGTAVYPEAYTTVKIPVPTGADASKLTPIYVDDAGVAHALTTKLTIGEDRYGNEVLREVPMTPTVTTEGGVTYMSFETNHFSTYGLATVTSRRGSSFPTTTVISNAEGNISAEGSFGPGYTLSSRALSSKSATYKQLAKLKDTGSVLGCWDVRISPAWPGSVSLSFNLGQRYADQEITLLHLLDNGSVEYLYGKADGIGRLSVSTRDCSTYMIIQGHIAASLVSIPDTGSAPRLSGALALLCLPAALSILPPLVTLLRRRKKGEK